MSANLRLGRHVSRSISGGVYIGMFAITIVREVTLDWGKLAENKAKMLYSTL